MQTWLDLNGTAQLTGVIVPLAHQLYNLAPEIGLRGGSCTLTRMHTFTTAILASSLAYLMDRRLICLATGRTILIYPNLIFALTLIGAVTAAIGTIYAADWFSKHFAASCTLYGLRFALSQGRSLTWNRTVLSLLCFAWQDFEALTALQADYCYTLGLSYVHTRKRAIPFSFSATHPNGYFFAAHFTWLDNALLHHFGGASS
jgi:hypothetical protein